MAALGRPVPSVAVARAGDPVSGVAAGCAKQFPSCDRILADSNGDGWLSDLKLARWNGSSWSIQTVETGTVGYGVFVALAFDPLTAQPCIAHSNAGGATGQVRFLRWDGVAWVLETPDATTGYRGGNSLAYAADGTAYLAYSIGGQMKVTRRDPISGIWTTEVVDPFGGGFLKSLKLSPDGKPSVSYQGTNSDLRFARREGP